jgi:formate-dependent nitrite reductase membrane component NrfD
VATYTAVLLADTATPGWHSAYRELPALFVSSAAAASGGLGMVGAPTSQAAPARRLAVAGAAVELVAEHQMERSMGLSAETLHADRGGRLMAAARWLTAGGALGTLVLGRRSRAAAIASGLALMAGSACTRFGVFEAGQASARDPKYTVVPQRERLARGTTAG